MTENDLSHLHAKAVNTNPSPPKQIIYLFIYLFEIKKQSLLKGKSSHSMLQTMCSF